MSIFPFIDVNINEPTTTENKQIAKEYAWDFENNNFILKDGKFVIVEGIEALKIWIFKALRTQRFRYLVYSWNYGNEIENIIGHGFLSNYAKESEIKRYIEESLLINPSIRSISNFKALITDDHIKFDFTAVTEYGEVIISV